MHLPPANLDLTTELEEFDIWITPSLGEITDTEKFKSQLALTRKAFELLGEATNKFDRPESCHPDKIGLVLAEILSRKTLSERLEILQSLGSILFLVTGKSDNNFKCQFPLFLRDHAGWSELPAAARGQLAKGSHSSRALPRTIYSESYLSLIANVNDSETEAKLLKEFIAFLLKDDDAVNQFWSVGYSYFALKPFGKGENLLAPLVIFTIRGSVMATEGHKPEAILRSLMTDWGLRPGIDFNLADVVILSSDADPERKKRAYDFVIPYTTPGWGEDWQNRLFIQSQFYAGDSGSVSHKNVDQTDTSRQRVLSFVPTALFLEYVDGAGYFSSLNGDLKRLLRYRSTKSFFQIRSAAIRLRRELQELGFLTPLDVEHAVVGSDGTKEKAFELLLGQSYSETEVRRAWKVSLETELIGPTKAGRFGIRDDRRDLIRRYLLMDVAASHGETADAARSAGKLLVPGYGAFFGLALDSLIEHAAVAAPGLRTELNDAKTVMRDVRWLCEQGFTLAR